MPKKKSAARVFTGDGVGGMVPVEDRRFDEGPWLMVMEIPAPRADDWMQYLELECSDRGWQCSSFGQMNADENSGSISVHMGTPGQSPQLAIVWDRPRSGPLTLRSRLEGPQTEDDQATAFIARVNERFRADEKQSFYRRGYLYYEGLPWNGELWLDSNVRLGLPAQHARWLIAPQVIVVDTLVNAIGWRGANALFASRMQELSLFLTVIMRTNVSLPPSGHVWTLEVEKRQSELHSLGFMEDGAPNEMPNPGQHSPVPLREVARPDFALHGISVAEREEWLPDDIHDLWSNYVDLPPERRDQFQRVARAVQMSYLLWSEHRTASLALRVVACEALKPQGRRYDRLNIYGVVEGLLGAQCSEVLKRLRFAPQRVRSEHLHRAKLFGAEDIQRLMLSTFWDPTFDQDYRVVAQVSDAAIIEWLGSGGTFAVPVVKKGKFNWRAVLSRLVRLVRLGS